MLLYSFPQIVQPCQRYLRAFSDVAIPRQMLTVPQSHIFQFRDMWNQLVVYFGLKIGLQLYLCPVKANSFTFFGIHL